MIRAEDENRVFLNSRFSQRPQQLAHAIIQRRAMRIVSGQDSPRFLLACCRNIRAKLQLFRIVQRPIFRRRGEIRVVRRSP